jgi:hypothetical protein
LLNVAHGERHMINALQVEHHAERRERSASRK